MEAQDRVEEEEEEEEAEEERRRKDDDEEEEAEEDEEEEEEEQEEEQKEDDLVRFRELLLARLPPVTIFFFHHTHDPVFGHVGMVGKRWCAPEGWRPEGLLRVRHTRTPRLHSTHSWLEDSLEFRRLSFVVHGTFPIPNTIGLCPPTTDQRAWRSAPLGRHGQWAKACKTACSPIVALARGARSDAVAARGCRLEASDLARGRGAAR